MSWNPDGRLKLIDGHLRRDLDPDMEVDVEVLDVNDEEARALLLSIDPLAALAQTQEQIHRGLLRPISRSSKPRGARQPRAACRRSPPAQVLPLAPRNSLSWSPAGVRDTR